MRLSAGLVLIVILASQFSCGTSGKAEFDRNRRLWRENNIKNYRMTVDLKKAGHAAPNGKFIINVRDGRSESIRNAADQEPVPEIVRFGKYTTLDEIFEYIEAEEQRGGNWDIKEIEYDPKFGYPRKVNLDKARVLDDELSFQVLQFETSE